MKSTLAILSVLVEVAALGRSAIATFLVVHAVTNDFVFSFFTVAVIEGVFLTSLFLMQVESTAPISALLALAFSAAMQFFELRVLDGSITSSEKDILRYVIAFAPVVILALSYIKRLVEGGVSSPFDFSRVVDFFKGAKTETPKPRGRPRGLKQGA